MKSIPLALSLVLTTGPAMAQIVSFADGYLTHVPAGTVIEFSYNNFDPTVPGTRQAIRAGRCGEVIFTKTSGPNWVLNLAGELVASVAANAQTQLLPPCVNGQFTEPRPSNFKLADGRLVAVGLTPGEFYQIQTTPIRRIRPNACGVVSARPTQNFPGNPSGWRLQGETLWQPFAYSSIGVPVCRTVNQVPTLYWPVQSDYFTNGPGATGGSGGSGSPDPT